MPLKGSFILFGLAAIPYLLIAASGGQAKPTYAADVLPVMKAHCASCHSGSSAAANLDLTNATGIKKAAGTKGSKASLLIQRLHGINGPQMPMGFAPLPKETIAKIAAWIDAGAVVETKEAKHWAYVKPVKPKLPLVTTYWVRNPIDSFVLARLRKEGFKPSPEASKETLLRRVYLDLIGLPPTPKQIDAFLLDKRPDAYERVVDFLLKNPHYGERQAEPWLDLSRYADSDGYEKDGLRTMWKYRDWLIGAFNRNLPYDRFTIEQLAGDLLPNATKDQLVATGFNRNTMMNLEGGVDQAEAHFNVVLDRVGTTSTVWLGSTIQCARCHDHKYDPFSQRDFYRMKAFFSNAVIQPRGPKELGEEKWYEPQIQVPTPAQEKQQNQLKLQVEELEQQMRASGPAMDAAFSNWLRDVKQSLSWVTAKPTSAISSGGATLTVQEDGIVAVTGKLPDSDDYNLVFKTPATPVGGVRIEAIADDSLPSRGPGRANNGNFVLTGVSSTYTVGAGLNLPIHCGLQVKHGPSDAVADYDQRDFEANKLLGKDENFGWAVSGAVGQSHEIILNLPLPSNASITLSLKQHWPGGKHLLGRFRVSFTAAANPVSLYQSRALRFALAKNDEVALRDYFRKVTPLLKATRKDLAHARNELAMLERRIPTALVMRDKPAEGPLTAFVHSRGEFLSPTEKVTAGFPAVLGSSKETPRNRLDLAKWLVSKENPLTARVQVNRLWEQCFGRGIVETSEDFGTQGSRPSHPELLDWLACEFMENGWDMKAMIRLIVTSATYRQSSNTYPALLARDPQNVLLARGPRFRLDAETIRDNALAASGLLSPKIGGPSVYPYQPEGVWDNPFDSTRWTESKGGDQYRRGLYTVIRRTSPYASFVNLDATSRESCTVRRIRTNTPLQALAMLNDKGMMEAARALGKRIVKEGGTTDTQRLTYGFRLCTVRKPTLAELKRLEQLLVKLWARYAKSSGRTKKLTSPSEAAWTMVGNVLLNLDGTITKT